MEKDVFSNGLSQDLILTYYEKSNLKSQLEKELKELKVLIEKRMAEANKEKTICNTDRGNFQVSITVPDKSRFDLDKVTKWLIDKGYEKALKLVVDEEKLSALIEEGEIDLEELKKISWIEEKGTPRLYIKPIKSKGEENK